ncbi:heavy-metal-associated domain-containing protein [Methylibium petroleiphilum]
MSNTIRFRVDDMTCGHCVRTITAAIQASDPRAEVEIDLAIRQVRVVSGTASADQLSRSITAAGYTPVAVNDAPTPVTGDSKAARHGDCRCC